MSRIQLLVSGTVLALCAGILVLFTDIELTAVRWFNCGPVASERDRQSDLCR